MQVAGLGALLVAKVHKIAERSGDANRLQDKDALDVLRLLKGIATGALASCLGHLRGSELSAAVTDEALAQLPTLCGALDSVGVIMAVRAAGPGEAPTTLALSLVALVADLRGAIAG